jgi:FtsH-binding integral membrane protein
MNAGYVDAATLDMGLRKYMLSIYNYMASAVMLSGIVALLFVQSGIAAQVFVTPLRWLIVLAPLGFVFAMSAGMGRMQTGTLKACFWGFAVAMGLSLSSLLLVYTGASIALTFLPLPALLLVSALWVTRRRRACRAWAAFDHGPVRPDHCLAHLDVLPRAGSGLCHLGAGRADLCGSDRL